ncbi:LysR family transcriptional regulator [Roseovarius aestuarii]|nr:LysR family transcriptional regulator [Roseovarius aestuarii]
MKLPPLNSLKVFEVVARLGSIRAAANELGSSPSTVSEHIKNIEYSVGVSLVQRNSNALVLTENGKTYARSIRSGLHEIARATEQLNSSRRADSLRVTCVPSLATSWIPDVLAKLKKAHPNFEVEFDFSPSPRELIIDGFDLAIRYGSGNYKDKQAELLLTDRIAPVCSPETKLWIKSEADLEFLDRIECSEGLNPIRSQWEHWLTTSFQNPEATPLSSKSITRVNSTTFALEMLLNSRAIAILDYNSVKAELEQGRLVCPLGGWVDAQHSYYIVYPKTKPLSKRAKQFKAALKSYVKNTAQPPQ